MMYQNVNDGKTPPGVPAKPSRHWSQRIQETVVSFGSEGLFHLSIRGGADIGQFPWIHDIKHNKVQYHSGRLYADDIVLEIQGQKVAGYTLRDTIDWLNQISRNGTPVMFKTVKTGHLPKDLKQYLNTRFQKSSCDHDLQQIIRDNLYLRTVPCTTRAPRPGELNGVDYTFLTAAEFFKLEANGSLLESGLFEDNHYGTPKPPKDPAQPSLFRRTNSTGTLLPGHHPSSEGKRRRNRSNIETVSATAAAVAAAAANKARTGGSPALMGKQRSLSGSSSAPPPLYRKPSMERVHGGNKIEGNNNDELGEMPPNWERDFTDDGTPYYIDHSTETTHWLDPRIALMKKKDIKECNLDELPYGWEKVEDEHYGTYYIDHVNRKTQYENPVKAAKDQLNISGGSASRTQSLSQADMNGVRPPPVYSTKKPYFTRDPEKLRGKFLRTSLKKSSRGLGFTIVGGDYGDEEFLQIKNVVPQGPAYLDGVLKTGDVLVYINGMPVLGCIHQDVVEIFQAMPADSMVELEVCRGYPLPFDPDDPDTEIVTTVAVSLPDSEKAGYTVTPPKGSNNSNKPVNTRSINSNSYNNTEEDYTDSVQNGGLSGGLNGGMNGDGLTLSVEIVKGPHGFGFTIFDTAIGQCVKQVMDHERCKELQEGDLLLSIDKKSLSHSTHNQVVQALQDCKHGTASLITVQRTGLPRSKLKKSGSSNLNNLKREDRAGSIDGNSQQNSNNSAYYGQNSDLLNDSHDSIGFTQDHHSGHGSEPSTTPVLPRRTQSTHEHGYKHDSLKDMHQAHHRGYQNGGPLYANDPHRQDPRGYDMDINDVRFRSRTPGPEFMRGNSDDMFSKSQQQVTRSKTPTNDGFLYGQQHSQYHNGPRSAGGNFGNNATAISGTPDFIPASRYTSPPSPRGNGTILYRHQNHDRGKARPLSSGPDLASNGSGVGSGMNSSHTYSGALNYATQNQRTAQPEGVSPSSSGGSSVQNPHTNNPTHSRRQHATSFEHETPSSALQHNSTWQNDVLNRSRSPGLNSAGSTGGYPDTTDERYVELTVFLKKHENGFGFRIIGGTEEGSQVSVGHIVPGGPADKDGRLRMGDEIIYVDGKNVLGYLHRQVVQVIGESSKAGRVSLGVRRKITHSTQTNDSSPYHNTDQTQFPYEVTVTRRRDEGFGFVIISSVTRAGSTIGRILPDSPAERCGLLRLGDRILEVDGVDIGKLHHEEIVTLIKDSGFSVTLLIGQPIDDLGTTPSMSQRSPSDNSTDPGVTVPHSGIPQTSAPQAATPQPDGPATVSSQGSMLNSLSTYTSREDASRRTEYSPYNSSHTTPTTAPTTAQNRYGNAPSGHQDLEDPTQSNATLAGYRQSPHVLDTYSKVDLHRGSRGFGFSIRGGQEFNSMPLYVLRIADGGAADLDQRLQVGDQIIEINGYNTNHMTHGEAINLIQTGGSTVHLLIKRTGKPPPHIGTTSESSNSTPLNNHITVNTKSGHVPKSRQTTHTPLSSNHSAFSNGPIGQSSPNLMNNARSAGYNVPQSRSGGDRLGGDRPGGVHNRQHSNTGYH